MSELRWILIGFGIVLLLSIYLWGRRTRGAPAQDELPVRAEPELRGTNMPTWQAPQGSAATAGNPAAREAAAPAGSAAADSSNADAYMATIVRPALRREPTLGEALPEAPSFVAGPAPLAGQEARPDIHEPSRQDAFAGEDAASGPAPAPSPIDGPAVDAHAPRRLERRKILSLRLSAVPQRLDGAKLLETLQQEGLEYGKYRVFHRLHEGVSVFSVASMVEPGIFEPELMAETDFPGVTLFAQLPGPVPGMHALNELVACARRLQQYLGGTLQDDRGVPLTVHRIERLRQEIREFERPAATGRMHPTS